MSTALVLARSAEEVETQIERSYERNYEGLTFAEGVRYALDWATGDSDDPPFEDEDEEDTDE